MGGNQSSRVCANIQRCPLYEKKVLSRLTDCQPLSRHVSLISEIAPGAIKMADTILTLQNVHIITTFCFNFI